MGSGAASPSPDNPPIVVQPFDVYDCGGCGQRLRFDARGFVPQAQLEGCRSRCDWTLVRRSPPEGVTPTSS